MTPATTPGGEALSQIAKEKLVRVFGPAKGEAIFTEAVRGAGLVAIGTPDDLYAFGDYLAARGGFEAAVGRLITVAATLRGARGNPVK